MKWEKVDVYPENDRRDKAKAILMEIYNSGANIAIIEDTEGEYVTIHSMLLSFAMTAKYLERKIDNSGTVNGSGKWVVAKPHRRIFTVTRSGNKIYVRVERPPEVG